MTRLPTLAAALLLAACTADPGPPRISVSDAWARETVAGQTSAAAYLTIASQGGGDRLIAASSPAAEAAMLHTTVMTDGIARMRMLPDGLPIESGETLRLAPKGAHVMLTGLRTPLREGATFELRLRFARSGEQVVTGRVVDAAAGGLHQGHSE